MARHRRAAGDRPAAAARRNNHLIARRPGPLPPPRRPDRRRRAVAVHAAALAAGPWLLWRVRQPGDLSAGRAPGEGAAPRRPGVAVVIPARDEAGSLPALLASLASQSLAPDELVVVDDHSTDGTGELAAAAGARVVAPPPLPAGWLGKPWACHHGAAATGADLLVFLDADVRLAPDALARLVADHGVAGGLLSVQPSHRPVERHEELSAVCNLVAMMGTGAFCAPPRPAADMAFGPCLLVDRDTYRAAGGHAHPAVRDQVAEDVGLARRALAAGRPVTVLAGAGLVGFRMYPGGWRQLVDGWSKMLADGAAKAPRLPAAVTFVWVTGAILGAGRGLRALTGRGAGRAVDAAVYLAWAAEMRWLLGRVGRFRRTTAAAFPAPLAAFVGIFARSAFLAASGRPVRWRERDVAAGDRGRRGGA